jgi:iron complex outermembrane receptor protein
MFKRDSVASISSHAAAATLAALILMPSAHAQNAASAADAAQGANGEAADQAAAPLGQLQEVVVTAEKRSQNLQAVAATVTAIGGGDILQQGVKDITDITRVAPEVNVTTGVLNNVGIRGIRTGSYGPTLDSANAVYLDGNYNARFTSLNGLFFDVQSVEVLDGPQGTLYGRNSAGGAMNIISNKPTQQFGGYGSVEFGNYNDLSLNGALNLPMSDTLALRVAYMRDSHSGYMTDSGQDDQNLQGGRAELLWKPSSADSLLLTAQESTVGGKGPGASTIVSVLKNPTITTNTTTGNVLAYNAACPAGDTCTSQVVPINATDNPRHNAVLVGNANLQRADNKSDDFALQYDHIFGSFADLTLQAARMSTTTYGVVGGTSGLEQSPLLVASGLFLVNGGASTYASAGWDNTQWDSQELRLTSIATAPLQWVVGLYRYHERGSGGDPTYSETPITAVGPTLGNVSIPPGPPVTTQDIPNILNEDHAQAAFTQLTWTPGFLPALHATGGLRYNWEHKHGIITITPSNGPLAIGAFGPTGIFDQAKTWTATNYKLNVSYDLTSRNLIYIDHSTGFQSGGFGYGASPAYEPTHIWAWEIGSKNRFFHNTLQVNASAWYYNYSNQTANISDVFLVNFVPAPYPPNYVPFNFITVANAGTSIDRGQSLDVQWNATPDDQIGANVQHINAVYTNFNLTQRYLAAAAKFGTTFSTLYPGYSPTGNQSGPSFNYNGTHVGGSPDWAFYGTYDHTFRFGEHNIDAQVVYRYNGKEVNGNQAAPNMPPAANFSELPAWSTWDLNLSYAPADGRYQVTLFSRNLFDKLYVTGRGYSSNGAALTPAAAAYAYETESFGPPRTYGVIVRANF